ncbi:MAG: hypothetical protein WA733_07865 [Methylocystis sp.]
MNARNTTDKRQIRRVLQRAEVERRMDIGHDHVMHDFLTTRQIQPLA